ncbi:lysophosphatidyl acyltransferase 5 [Striga asiatica]|uniref:Lysophosphatidyl acyltransferase 5 n=1 Tax=Striga asiatica TaxID=4170 RepID=A0A5A7PYH3_STRAF|nr:lysophosphatidyl acyltransferase 5 [Striga asiatica]
MVKARAREETKERNMQIKEKKNIQNNYHVPRTKGQISCQAQAQEIGLNEHRLIKTVIFKNQHQTKPTSEDCEGHFRNLFHVSLEREPISFSAIGVLGIYSIKAIMASARCQARDNLKVYSAGRNVIRAFENALKLEKQSCQIY